MKLTILVGPPGCGKSTLAANLIRSTGAPEILTAVYINQDSQGRDHLQNFEQAIKDGKDIVVDRMNFDKNQRARYLDPAKRNGYATKIVVIHEPYKVCLERCLKRENHETIKDEKAARSAIGFFFSKYERPIANEADEVVYKYPSGVKPSAIICDLDGTLCNVEHRLHFVRKPPGEKKDWKNFFYNLLDDKVNEWCADILHGLSRNNVIVYCSGRPDDHRASTEQWLQSNDLHGINVMNPYKACNILFMRPRNDQRDDSIVKEIILDFEILTRFTPSFMIDDRKRVVDMWRRRGFTCLACADGDF